MKLCVSVEILPQSDTKKFCKIGCKFEYVHKQTQFLLIRIEFTFQLRDIICQFHYLVIGKINWVKGLFQKIHKKEKRKKKMYEIW